MKKIVVAEDSFKGCMSSVQVAKAVALLAMRPICGVSVDPLVALPAGGLVLAVSSVCTYLLLYS